MRTFEHDQPDSLGGALNQPNRPQSEALQRWEKARAELLGLRAELARLGTPALPLLREAIARQVREVFQATACSLYVADGQPCFGEGPSGPFQLAAVSPEGWQAARMLDLSAFRDTPREFHVPLKGRQRALLALLVIHNPADTPQRNEAVGSPDRAGSAVFYLAVLVESWLAVFLEDVSRDYPGTPPSAEPCGPVLRAWPFVEWPATPDHLLVAATLQEAIRVSSAERAGLAVNGHRNAHHPLRVALEWPWSSRVGQTVPDEDPILSAWYGGRVRVVRTGTGHLAAIPIRSKAKQVGLLYVDGLSNLPDAAIKQQLQSLSQRLGIAFEPGPAPQHRPHPRHVLLEALIRSLWELFRLGAGIIYTPDFAERQLIGLVRIARDGGLRADSYTYDFDERSVATEVFRTGKPYYTANAERDRVAHPRGVEAFGIRGPLLGVPLTFGGQTVGVLVVWSYEAGCAPVRSDLGRLSPFAELAAVVVAASLAQGEWPCGEAIPGPLRGVMQTLNSVDGEMEAIYRVVCTAVRGPADGRHLRRDMRLILHGVQAAGFDRVRWWTYDPHEREFVYQDALQKPTDHYIRRIRLEESRHAQMIVQQAASGEVQVHNPAESGLLDPHAAALDRPIYLPWAVAPLLSGPDLLAQIATDNAYTLRGFSDSSCVYLHRFGALAQAVLTTWSGIPARIARRIADLNIVMCLGDALQVSKLRRVGRGPGAVWRATVSRADTTEKVGDLDIEAVTGADVKWQPVRDQPNGLM